jgi:ABC-type bacteriocin/lantibiotic exporter with double-glycine peptidase domain
LLPGTLLENILAGQDQWNEADAWAAARLACIDEDIESMPMGMYTFVSEGGSNFSAGQRQRILIARALVRQPSLLLLDEATSAIDNRVQTRLLENIRKLGATCILSSHRMTAMQGADRLFVLDKGRIIQHGSYRELINQNGLLSSLGPAPTQR